MIRKLKISALVISLVLFITSLTQPAFYISAAEPDGWANSLGLLLIGWSGALYGGAGLAWLANPLIILSWIFSFKKIGTSMATGFFAMLFAFSFLAFDSIITGEDGHYSIITHRAAGYWLWLLSIAFFALSNMLIYIIEQYPTPKQKQLVENEIN